MTEDGFDCRCGEEISTARHALGYRTCLVCGESQARKLKDHKAKCVVTMHKSNSVYVTSPTQAREVAQMRRGIHG